jgi:hypothetical protein
MASRAYYIWDSAGRHWELARPIAELVEWAHRNGVEVLGTIGNEEHLTHEPPQDHTPFSATAWPEPLPGYIVTAIDLKNINELGARIEVQARAGMLPWIKYMNHDGEHLDSRDLDGDGKTWEEYPSSDQHVHLSIRTDWISKSIGDFDPFSTGVDDVSGEDVWNTKIGSPALGGRWATGQPASEYLKYTVSTAAEVTAMHAELSALRGVIDQLAAIIQAGGGSVDTVGIFAGLDERLAAFRAQVEADTRDAVADLAEGGATAVRTDA